MANHGTRRIAKGTGIEYVVGEWCPELVGKVPGYPKTADAYDRVRAQLKANREVALKRRRLTRHGVPNGWAGRKPELAQTRRNAQHRAEQLMDELIAERVFVPDCREARIALEAALAIIADRSLLAKHRLAAARIVLEYTLPKPTKNVRKTMWRAEDLLQRWVDATPSVGRENDPTNG